MKRMLIIPSLLAVTTLISACAPGGRKEAEAANSPPPAATAPVENSLASRDIETLKVDIGTLKTESERLKGEVTSLKKSLSRLLERFTKSEQIAEQIAAKDDVIEMKDRAIAEAQGEKAKLDKLVKDPRNSPDAKRHFQGQLNATTKRLEELSAEKASLVKEREKLESDLSAIRKAAK